MRLNLKRAFVDPAVYHAIKARSALIEEGRWSKVRVARINSRAASQQLMGESRAAVVLQWAEQRISVDLIARAVQIPAGIITAEIEAMRRHRAAVIEKGSTPGAAVQDGVADIQCGGATKGRGVIDGATRVS